LNFRENKYSVGRMDATRLDAERAQAVYAEIVREARSAGLLRPATCTVLLRALLGSAGLIALLAVAWSAESTPLALVAAGLAGVACIQLGFIAHDAGHGAVGRGPFSNGIAGHLAFTLLNGLGFRSWRESHAQHHAFCQDESRDPDMAVDVVMSLTPRSAAEKSGLGRALLPYQGCVLWPAALLFAHSLRLQSLARSYRAPARYLGDTLLLPLHYAGWLALPGLAFGTGSLRSAAVYLTCSAVMGMYLAVLFWVNHVGMPAFSPQHGLTSLEQQVLGTRNVRHSRSLDLVFGGLGFQIEHHLMPGVPSAHLRQLQAIARPRCLALGLPYHEETPGQALASVTRHVSRIARLAHSR
jgi:fatty acid desaturase